MDWWQVAGSFLAGIITLGVPGYIMYRKAVQELNEKDYALRKTQRTDAMEELQKLMKMASDEVHQMDVKLAKSEEKATNQERQIQGLIQENVKCFKESSKQAAQIEIMRSELANLRTLVYTRRGQSGWATVTADLNGMIVDASDEVRDMFGWRPAELIGKSVEVLMTDEYKKAHRAGLVAARAGHERPQGQAITGYALQRTGTQKPVTVILNYTSKSEVGKVVIAEIYDRSVAEKMVEQAVKAEIAPRDNGNGNGNGNGSSKL